MWWVFAGISIFLLVVSLAFLSVRGLLSLASDGENDLWLPEYVPPVVSTAPDLEPSDDPWNVPDEPSDDPWSTPDDPDDWNADGSWVLGANYLYGEWVSDLYSDGTVECLYFDDDGYVELWEGLPGSAGDDIDTWYDGDWEKTLLYSGSYWVDGDYLTLEFEDSHATYYVDMVSLFDIDVYFDDGSVTHFEQVSW